ncbi:hypothetical protein KVV02_000390 [Mortierella alpina]|uniref:Uncharacterized protein n=1 Tax=Mortierella alpina TaxID=64518 RepID=A0A9P8D2T4_MORAP|nr:hypothetical protein KVV02_000390 [Mortierella alpina]
MAAIVPRTSRTRQHTKPTPPDLILQDKTPQQSQTLSNSNSSSSINSQRSHPQQHQQYQHQSQGQHRQVSPHGPDPYSLGGQFQTYGAQYPTYRPYTPTTPTTPTTLHGIAIPSTPTFPASPRLEHSASFSSQGKPASTSGGLFPYAKNQRGTSTRRVPSSESSLYDPYRSRQSGVSASRVKNEYQAQSPIRENHATFPQQGQPYASRHGSSDEIHEMQPQLLEGEALTGEQAFKLMHPPSLAHREEQYRQSPTLTASQTLAATYGPRPDSPLYMPYQAHQAYQPPLPSPSIIDTYRSSAGFSSPGLSPHHAYFGSQHEDRSDHKADPYRSAYSLSASNSNNNNNNSTSPGHPFGSPYLGSLSSSPNPNDDFSSSFESRLSGVSSQQQSSSSHPRYPLGQDSNQALSASFYEGSRQQQNKKPATTASTATSSENEGLSAQKEASSTTAAAATGLATSQSPSVYTARSSTLKKQHLSSLPSKTDSSATKKAKVDEDEENDVILQKLGVLSIDSSNGSRSVGTRSGVTNGSGRSARRKGQWTDGSEEEEGRRKGARNAMAGPQRRRENAPKRCCCCSRRACVYITFTSLISLAVMLFFIIPRTPTFTFESVSSLGPPIVTKNRIREPFAMQILVDSRENYLPIRIDQVDMVVLLKTHQVQIADNFNMASGFVLQPRREQIMSITMNLDYKTNEKDSATDRIFQQLIDVCTPVDTTDSSADIPGISLTIGGRLHVWGLSWVWKPQFVVDADNVPCPVNARDPASDTPSPSMVHPIPSVTAVMSSDTSHLPQVLAASPPAHSVGSGGRRRRALARIAAARATSRVESAPLPTTTANDAL